MIFLDSWLVGLPEKCFLGPIPLLRLARLSGFGINQMATLQEIEHSSPSERPVEYNDRMPIYVFHVDVPRPRISIRIRGDRIFTGISRMRLHSEVLPEEP
jgi:hypothetical protein